MKNLFAFSSAFLFIFAFTSLRGDTSIKNMEIKTRPGKVSVQPFKYTVDGKELECKGAAFETELIKPEQMELKFSLRPAGYRDNIWVFMSNKLPVRNILDFKMTDNSGKVLKEGVDYRLSKQGAVSQLKPKKGAPRQKAIPVSAEFSYLPSRYDSIFLDPENGKLSLVKGVKRKVDAEEYVPKTPAGKIRICNIDVTGDKLKVIPCYEKKNPVVKGDLSRFIKNLKSGKPVKVLGYGDSITAVQRGNVPFTMNSQNRDRYERYLTRYPKDTVELVEKFDFNDGAGKKHCKIGWNWKLVETIEAKYGNKVQYLNGAIGGTRSDVNGNHGLAPARIKLALDSKPDLVVLAFGMNELGSKHTAKNMDTLIKKFKAVGADIIVMGVPQINGLRGNTQKAWKSTNNVLKKVAVANSCTFVDTALVNLEIAPEHICSANQYNHPGIGELEKYSRALAEVLQDSSK